MRRWEIINKVTPKRTVQNTYSKSHGDLRLAKALYKN